MNRIQNLVVGLFLVAMTAAIVFVGCSTPTTSSTSNQAQSSSADVLRVGVAPQLPPLIFKERGRIQGLEADLARALAADMGKEVSFVELQWNDLIDALLKGRIDIIMSGMSITQARLMRVNFAKPYLQAGQTALIRRTDMTLMQFQLFSQKTSVGAQKGTTGDFFSQQNFPKSPRKLYPRASDGARALKNKDIDAFICDAPVNWWLASENEAAGLAVLGGYLTEEYLAWGIRKDEPQTLEAANRFIASATQSGQLQGIITNWIPYR